MNPRYDLQERVAQSVQGTVWRAQDRETGRRVAVKQPGGPAQLLRVQHPSVVRVLDIDADMMVMEWCEGETLEERGKLNAAEFDALVRQTLAGLAAIHEAGLLHLDLKPENVRIYDLRFMIYDFGLVRAMGEKGNMTGSIHYMAPEYFSAGVIDERTDLYALGCTFYFAQTGKTAFEGDLKPQVITAHLQHRVEPLQGELGQWLERLMSLRAADRFQTAREALLAYEALDCELSVAVQPRSPLSCVHGKDTEPQS